MRIFLNKNTQKGITSAKRAKVMPIQSLPLLEQRCYCLLGPLVLNSLLGYNTIVAYIYEKINAFYAYFPYFSLKFDLFFDIFDRFFHGNADLFHTVAVADGHGAVFKRLEIDGHAERGADLVLTAVTLTDRAREVVGRGEFLAHCRVDFVRFFRKALLKGQDGALIGRERGVQTEHRADIVLFRVDDFLVVGVREEREHHSVRAERRLDDVGHVFFARDGVGVVNRLAAFLGVLGKVVVRSVGDAPKLAPAECEVIFKIGGRFGIEAQLLGGMIAQVQIFRFHTEGKKPIAAEVFPIFKPFEVGAGLAEELQLHLLEFAGAEREVAGRDLVSEGFTDLCDTERHAHTGRTLDVLEVHEDALRRFGTKVDGVRAVLGDALEGLKHQIELADRSEIGVAADGANNLMLGNKRFERVVVHTLHGDVHFMLLNVVFDEVIRAVARLASLAVHEGIGEAAEVPRSLPRAGVHEDCAVYARVVGVFLHEFFPPRLFDVVFELYAQRTVVPRVREPAVNFTAREDKPAVFTKGNELFHRHRSFFCHDTFSFSAAAWNCEANIRIVIIIRFFPF